MMINYINASHIQNIYTHFLSLSLSLRFICFFTSLLLFVISLPFYICMNRCVHSRSYSSSQMNSKEYTHTDIDIIFFCIFAIKNSVVVSSFLWKIFHSKFIWKLKWKIPLCRFAENSTVNQWVNYHLIGFSQQNDLFN